MIDKSITLGEYLVIVYGATKENVLYRFKEYQSIKKIQSFELDNKIKESKKYYND
jgi:hypothetical protein